MNNYIEAALLTWYAVDHPLHKEKLHPALGLAGEAGELLDLYKKNQYKPGFDWFDCKHCKFNMEAHDRYPHGIYKATFGTGQASLVIASDQEMIICNNYTSFVFDELGDFSYYLRILSYLAGLDIPAQYVVDRNILDLLIDLNGLSHTVLASVRDDHYISPKFLDKLWRVFYCICQQLEITPEQVFELNFKKLNSEETKHGWFVSESKEGGVVDFFGEGEK